MLNAVFLLLLRLLLTFILLFKRFLLFYVFLCDHSKFLIYGHIRVPYIREEPRCKTVVGLHKERIIPMLILVFNNMFIIVFRGNLLMALRNRADEPHAITPVPIPKSVLLNMSVLLMHLLAT